jgi:hypothetical protein
MWLEWRGNFEPRRQVLAGYYYSRNAMRLGYSQGLRPSVEGWGDARYDIVVVGNQSQKWKEKKVR